MMKGPALAMACLALAGCAASPGFEQDMRDGTAPPFRDPAMSMQAAGNIVATGTATKAGVRAALGPATVVGFDSGNEVWVYREKNPREPSKASKAEFVILFAPDGTVKKTRVRPDDPKPPR